MSRKSICISSSFTVVSKPQLLKFLPGIIVVIFAFHGNIFCKSLIKTQIFK